GPPGRPIVGVEDEESIAGLGIVRSGSQERHEQRSDRVQARDEVVDGSRGKRVKLLEGQEPTPMAGGKLERVGEDAIDHGIDGLATTPFQRSRRDGPIQTHTLAKLSPDEREDVLEVLSG